MTFSRSDADLTFSFLFLARPDHLPTERRLNDARRNDDDLWNDGGGGGRGGMRRAFPAGEFVTQQIAYVCVLIEVN